ncbi:Rab GTPase-activating protein 22-like protein [Drosera capensis]
MIKHRKEMSTTKALERSHNSTPSSSSSSVIRASSSSVTASSSSSSKASSPPSSSSSWIHLRSVLFVVTFSSSSASSPATSNRGSLKSPWSRRRRKHSLLPKQWKNLFEPDGKLCDAGIKFLKKVRSGGVDPSIRAEVWPFLLGVYDLNSSRKEREAIRDQKRKEYVKLRRQCRRILKQHKSAKANETVGNCGTVGEDLSQVLDSPDSGDDASAQGSNEGASPSKSDGPIWDTEVEPTAPLLEVEGDISVVTCEDDPDAVTDSSDSESYEEDENEPFLTAEENMRNDLFDRTSASPSFESRLKSCSLEEFASWQRIIRLDAARANDEWVVYSTAQASVSETKARKLAERVGLKDFDHLEPCRTYHAARLVAILEAYALYDPEIGYCQGMSDLLSPIVSVIEEDHVAFWCFAGFMRKARHNFQLDEEGIRRQLGVISKIIKSKDSHLYSHLEKLQAEDCFFLYRMVVVLFRRELTFEQTLCLWEVIWADQAAIRAGISKSAWGKMRLRAPPTEDLLLYAIAACVLQRKKLIVEKYSTMDEILRECNDLAGQLDVWKLLHDAHDLVVALHDKI